MRIKTAYSILIGMLIIPLVILPLIVSAVSGYSYSRFAVAQSWAPGTDEYWHIQPVGEKKEFAPGEKIQFFAQVGPIGLDHQWRLVLYRGNAIHRTVTNDRFHPDWNGWNYSNFVPVMSDLPAGAYRADYLLDTGSGFKKLASVSFSVVQPKASYIFDHAVTATGWQFGATDHWNLQTINQRTNFDQGATVYLVLQNRKVYVDHRYKVELYRLDSGTQTKMWEYVTPYNFVGNGWAYSNFYPYYANAASGNYLFRSYIDTGNGWTWQATVPFTVGNVASERYTYDRTTLARGWKYGSPDQWNLQPVDPTNRFNKGDDAYAISIVRNILSDYQWKSEIFRDGKSIWQDTTSWRGVGSGQAFGAYYPRYSDAQPGSYQWKIYINSGTGFKLLDTKPFTVNNQAATSSNFAYIGTETSLSWSYASDNDARNIQAVNPRSSFDRGSTIYIVSRARNIKTIHRWRIETYRNGVLQWTYYSPWYNLGGTLWPYSSVMASNYASEQGSYQAKIFFDDGSGFRQLDSKSFSVN